MKMPKQQVAKPFAGAFNKAQPPSLSKTPAMKKTSAAFGAVRCRFPALCANSRCDSGSEKVRLEFLTGVKTTFLMR